MISVFPWGCSSEQKAPPKPAPAVPLDPLKLARHYQALLDTGRFENRAALARHLGVSRARVTQVLRQADLVNPPIWLGPRLGGKNDLPYYTLWCNIWATSDCGDEPPHASR